MIRIKHIAADGRVTKAVDLTPDSTASEVAEAQALIAGLMAEDRETKNTLGIVAKPITEAEREAAAAAASEEAAKV